MRARTWLVAGTQVTPSHELSQPLRNRRCKVECRRRSDEQTSNGFVMSCDLVLIFGIPHGREAQDCGGAFVHWRLIILVSLSLSLCLSYSEKWHSQISREIAESPCDRSWGSGEEGRGRGADSPQPHRPGLTLNNITVFPLVFLPCHWSGPPSPWTVGDAARFAGCVGDILQCTVGIELTLCIPNGPLPALASIWWEDDT